MSRLKIHKDVDMETENEKINETNEELGSWTKEMLNPENLIGPCNSTEEMMKSLWDEE